ncbi:hypothetical protein EVAR_28482_1 [Eumeta japonica]|uniref:Uncharacterized protein n=1 Tax=Eumeta variegata TaxID=151549 RepID=A0A4C1WQK8_EUMVA|nr:hypothetical protein EVAR_28482_1 [Eumeta japonica]
MCSAMCSSTAPWAWLERKRQSTAWLWHEEPTPAKVRPARGAGKILTANFSDRTSASPRQRSALGAQHELRTLCAG